MGTGGYLRATIDGSGPHSASIVLPQMVNLIALSWREDRIIVDEVIVGARGSMSSGARRRPHLLRSHNRSHVVKKEHR